MLYIAICILGATVMPHNLYLHSSIVQTRAFGSSSRDRREAVWYAIFDSTLALGFALFINAAILILGAAAFHTRGLHNVAEIADAYKLLSPVLGASLASTLFACALLASGQNSTLTGTLAGQIVMEGFLDIRLKPWLRRLITRSIAIIPAALVIGVAGENKVTSLLILSQVILSFQLPFAVIPLIQFTSNRAKMGEFVNSRFTILVAWVVAAAILFFNAVLVWLILRSTSEYRAQCHGEQGKGYGPEARTHSPLPADLSDGRRMSAVTDGEIFYQITEGRRPMPSFKTRLSQDQRWGLVLFVRSLCVPSVAPVQEKIPDADKKTTPSSKD